MTNGAQFRSVEDSQLVHDLLLKVQVACEACSGNGRVEMLEHCPTCHGSGTVPRYPDGLRTWAEQRWGWPMVVWWVNLQANEGIGPELEIEDTFPFAFDDYHQWLPALSAEWVLNAYCAATGIKYTPLEDNADRMVDAIVERERKDND